ncbi:MAG TPA: LuxR C-terminal-related transcriptional regulator [Candidatus Binatia bacterium]|jgi:DNA-binding CsgD family transcriptional regulator
MRKILAREKDGRERKDGLDTFMEYAAKCHTPKQFQRLLLYFREIVPYRCMVYGWGSPTTLAAARVGDIDYPRAFLNWYFSSGMPQRDTLLQEWLRTRRCQYWADVFSRLGDQFDPTYVKQAVSYGLEHTMAGGAIEVEGKVGSYFSLAMNSEEECRNKFETFAALVPCVAVAFRRSYAMPILHDEKKKEILKLLSWGFEQKEIGHSLGITERTVKKHVEVIKKKLYARNTHNAVAIALRWGLIE